MHDHFYSLKNEMSGSEEERKEQLAHYGQSVVVRSINDSNYSGPTE